MKIRLLFLTCLALLLLPGAALAADLVGKTSDAPPLPHDQLLNSTQFYAMLAAAVLQGATYLINHYAPWVSEKAKTVFTVAFAALVGAVVQLIDRGTLAFDTNTLETIGFAVAAALAAHGFLWKPSTAAVALKAGTNKPGQPSPS